jgi:hypothetical protein
MFATPAGMITTQLLTSYLNILVPPHPSDSIPPSISIEMTKVGDSVTSMFLLWMKTEIVLLLIMYVEKRIFLKTMFVPMPVQVGYMSVMSQLVKNPLSMEYLRMDTTLLTIQTSLCMKKESGLCKTVTYTFIIPE